MSTKDNILRIWSDSSLDSLLTAHEQHRPVEGGHWEFALADPGLHVHAYARQAYERADFDYLVSVNFELAHTDGLTQASQQAAFFLSVVVREDVTKATLDHDGYWLIFAKCDGVYTVTSSQWGRDFEITKAMCAELAARGIEWSTADYGEDSVHVPW